MRTLLLCLCCALLAAADQKPWESGEITPAWAKLQAKQSIRHRYFADKSPEENGKELVSRCARLRPGDELVIEGGTYSVNRYWNLSVQGLPEAPVRITAVPGERVVITRPDRKQNVINIAADAKAPTQYLAISNLEFTGGSSLMRLYHCSHVWIDRCQFYDGGNVAIIANSADTDHLFITRNTIRNPGTADSTSEGMYLGANEGKHVMRNSVIAFNDVSECRGTQGDGIEVKQGSYDNWIVGNRIYNCDYPCLTIYGSNGKGINMVESNVCWNSKNHCIQIQGDAIVRNNIAINAGGAAFYTRDHQGPVDKLQVYHNTFVNQGNAVELRNWAGKNKMQFLNNACYSLSGDAIKVVAGADGALIAKNVCFGQVSGLEDGFSKSKKGLADFMNLRLDASARDARPAKSSSLSGRAEPIPEFTHDLYRIKRPRKPSVGAVEPRSTDIRRLQAKEYSVKLRTKKMPQYDDSFWQSEEPGPAWSFLSHSYKKQQWTLWWPPAPKQ